MQNVPPLNAPFRMLYFEMIITIKVTKADQSGANFNYVKWGRSMKQLVDGQKMNQQ